MFGLVDFACQAYSAYPITVQNHILEEVMLKPYMIFSRYAGPSEGAGLVFAHTSREARKIGWQTFYGMFFDEFIDLGCRWLKDCSWLMAEKKSDLPHAVDNPKSCKVCECWGQSVIGEDGMCEECREEVDDGR